MNEQHILDLIYVGAEITFVAVADSYFVHLQAVKLISAQEKLASKSSLPKRTVQGLVLSESILDKVRRLAANGISAVFGNPLYGKVRML